jgi:hypothetical protein
MHVHERDADVLGLRPPDGDLAVVGDLHDEAAVAQHVGDALGHLSELCSTTPNTRFCKTTPCIKKLI